MHNSYWTIRYHADNPATTKCDSHRRPVLYLSRTMAIAHCKRLGKEYPNAGVYDHDSVPDMASVRDGVMVGEWP